MGKMLSRRQMQHLCICLALGLLLSSLWQAAAWSRTQLHTGDAVCADTLRLHIRAASDAVADQSAKLRVRDAVLACLDAACPAGNQTDARSWAARNLFTLQLAARHALARCGVNAPRSRFSAVASLNSRKLWSVSSVAGLPSISA